MSTHLTVPATEGRRGSVGNARQDSLEVALCRVSQHYPGLFCYRKKSTPSTEGEFCSAFDLNSPSLMQGIYIILI